ncbi:MAG: acyltransferase domain-containing protein, partial [Dermatophilaceae bacterium]
MSIAVYASPHQTVIAGPPEQVDAVIAVLTGVDRLARRIEVDVASHHRIIEPILPELHSALADLAPAEPAIPVISTTYDPADGVPPRFDAEHWAANLRNPVRFSQAIATAGQHHATFIEISPHPLLTHAITDTLAGTHHHSIGTLQRDTDDTHTFHTNLNTTHTTRPPRTEHPPEPHSAIPTTPWHHTHHWIDLLVGSSGRDERAHGARTIAVHPLLGVHVRLPEEPERHVWQGEVGTTALPWLSDHQVHAVPAFPGAAYCEMALAAARATLGDASELRDIRFEQMLLLDEQTPVTAVASVEAPGVVAFEVETNHEGEHERRAVAVLHAAEDEDQPPAQDMATLLASHPNRVDGSELRQWCDERGIQYGPAFAGLAAAHTSDGMDGTVLTEVELPEPIRSQQTAYGVHPALLDACFQSVVAHPRISDVSDGGLLLPLGVRRLRSYGPLQNARYCLSRVTEANRTGMEADLDVFDENGTVVLTVRGLQLGSGVTESSARQRVLADRLLTIDWQQRELPAAGDADAGTWLLVITSDT